MSISNACAERIRKKYPKNYTHHFGEFKSISRQSYIVILSYLLYFSDHFTFYFYMFKLYFENNIFPREIEIETIEFR